MLRPWVGTGRVKVSRGALGAPSQPGPRSPTAVSEGVFPVTGVQVDARAPGITAGVEGRPVSNPASPEQGHTVLVKMDSHCDVTPQQCAHYTALGALRLQSGVWGKCPFPTSVCLPGKVGEEPLSRPITSRAWLPRSSGALAPSQPRRRPPTPSCNALKGWQLTCLLEGAWDSYFVPSM